MKSNISRRNFLMKSLRHTGALSVLVSALPFLSSCSTLDEYLIEDQFDFDQEVVIVGGGVAGLFAAYELKRNKIPFKIFENSSRLGGKIQTIGNVEWGAFEFQKNDTLLNALVKELNLEKLELEQQKWTLKRGASALIEELSEIVQGLIPEKQIRLQHELLSVRKIGSRYQLTFRTAGRERIYFARRIVLAMPQSAILKLRHLGDIKDVQPLLNQLAHARNWTNIRVNVNLTDLNKEYKKASRIDADAIRTHFYKLTSAASAQIFISQRLNQVVLTFRMTPDHPLRPIQHLESFIQKLTHPDFVLTSENCKDWGGEVMDSRASQEIDVKSIAFPAGRLKIVSESLVAVSGLPTSLASRSSIESLLQLVKQEVQFFKLDI